jgi:lipoprotein signal peptidase
MLLGGAAGNIVDRVRHGSVTDFIKLPLGWPPFNLADASITLGIVILLLAADQARRDHLAERSPREHPADQARGEHPGRDG